MLKGFWLWVKVLNFNYQLLLLLSIKYEPLVFLMCSVDRFFTISFPIVHFHFIYSKFSFAYWNHSRQTVKTELPILSVTALANDYQQFYFCYSWLTKDQPLKVVQYPWNRPEHNFQFYWKTEAKSNVNQLFYLSSTLIFSNYLHCF